MVNKNIIVTLFVTAAAAVPQTGAAQKAAYNTPGAGNPILPGYFADPTIKKFGDTYYIYATTDGSGAGFGPAQLWCSKDFKNWTLMPMNWPDSHWIWAPDVMKNEADGKYYYLYCQPCKLHLGVGDTPRGPWKNVLGESEAVLVPDRFVKNAITLDGQTFRDDDGSVYMYWGTWGIYKGFGCGAGKLNPDMKSFSETKLIPNTEVTHFFEAPFVFKRNGIYYFLYSCEHCEDASYRVDYATAKSPLGPYTYHGTILKTIAENECVADFTSSHDELEKLMLVNGTEPRCGVMNHYGWYEDAGYKEMKTLEGKWQHVYVCFDGRIESIYINDKLISQKDIQLLVKPSQFMLLGKNAEEAWPFSGYLHSLKLWDEYIPKK